jgi:hypothetical protein
MMVNKVFLTLFLALIGKLIVLSVFWMHYSHIAPEPYQIWGGDEAHWVSLGEKICISLEKNGFRTFTNLKGITETYHYGWSLILGIIFFIFGKNIFYALLIKQLIYAVGCYYFYKLAIVMNYSRKVSYWAFLFAVFYPPLCINAFTMFREEVIFTFMVIALYNIYKSIGVSFSFINLLFAFSFILYLCTVRLHVGLILMLLSSIMLLKEFSWKYRLTFLFTIPFILYYAFGFFFHYALGFINVSIGGLTLFDTFYSYIRFMVSPLPWKIVPGVQHNFTAWWYCISLAFIITSPLYLKEIFNSIIRNKVIFSLIILYFFSYALNAALFGDSRMSIGPRQFCVIGPLFFLISFSQILDKIVLFKSSRILI